LSFLFIINRIDIASITLLIIAHLSIEPHFEPSGDIHMILLRMYGRIQKDRVMEMKKWAGKVKKTIKEEGKGGGRKSINPAIVSA
jgi:hypothetical protein